MVIQTGILPNCIARASLMLGHGTVVNGHTNWNPAQLHSQGITDEDTYYVCTNFCVKCGSI